MADKIVQNLNGVSETLLMTLYTRAIESQRPDALLKDERAVEMVQHLAGDFSRLRLQGHDEVVLILRTREFDRLVREFLARSPQAVVVYLGCGLDSRFERVDNGQVEWYDLDLPEVIELRKQMSAGEKPRCHLLSSSAFETAWMQDLSEHTQGPFLFITEGVLPYFHEEQVKGLVLNLREHFPDAELICDAQSPFIIRADNLHLAITGVQARLHWGLKHAKDVETWAAGICLLEEWYYFDRPEPRLKGMRWMRFFPFLGKSAGIFHYRLGPIDPLKG